MSDKGTASTRGGTGLLPAGIIIALLAAVAGYLTLRPAETPEEAEVTSVVEQAAPAQETVAVAPETPSESKETAPVDPEPAALPPSVDEVRVDGDGMLVIAGRGQPGSDVDVLLDGEVVTTATVDAGGAFAALASIGASGAARSLTLRSGAGQAAVASAEEIILAPVRRTQEADVAEAADPAPQEDNVAVAAVTPEPEETPTSDPQVTADDADTPAAEAQEGVSEAEAPAPAVETVRAEDTPTGTAPQETAEEPQVIAQASSSVPAAEDQTEPPAAASQEAPATGSSDAPDTEDNQQIAVLKSDDSGVTLLQTAPVPPSRVVLDTIGYGESGVVQLSGRANVEASEVRAYLNNRSVARLEVAEDGSWRGDVPDIDPGVYTLRIDALTDEGRVTSRIETPFKREAPSVLAAATQNPQDAGPVRAVTVQAGDTLWAIARERYGEGLLYVQVFEANRGAIRDPDLIYPGQVFDLPDDG